ncbi:MAG: multicopper oxidase domain-containing protein [Gemmatimonadales bacterium]
MKPMGPVLILIALFSAGFMKREPRTGDASRTAVPVVDANDNRTPAGVSRNDTLKIDLAIQIARWYPEAADGPSVEVPVFTEVGHAPQIPAPLIRVRTGTTIVATVKNSLSDSVTWVRGLVSHPTAPDSVPIKPGESHTFTFSAGAPGTYMYSALPGRIIPPIVAADRINEQEQLVGAFVVDSVGAPINDRIFVMNIWGNRLRPDKYRNALAINGKSWPFTERIAAGVGDTVRWRVINGSGRRHPMHLHGFYFRVDSRGTTTGDTIYSSGARRLAVTEDMAPATTMSMVWSPDRPGNWLFHCHLTFHVTSGARLDGPGEEHIMHDANPSTHMAGLVLGINVKPGVGGKTAAEVNWNGGNVQRLRLFADERPRTGRTPFAMSYVLQRDNRAPAVDSIESPGQPIVMTRGVPTQVTVLNRSHDGTAVHWHGIELESYSDGVAGWSGAMNKLAPMIAPNDSFIAHLTLKRAGTFIYHTHLNDVEQITSGMYGPIVVLEPGEKYDPSRDHTFTIGWDGPQTSDPRVVVNGDSISQPLELKSGVTHRLRFVNIAPALRFIISIERDSTPGKWTPRAKDGADLPPALRKPGTARTAIDVGETFDAEFDPTPGEYRLSIIQPALKILRTKKIIVR